MVSYVVAASTTSNGVPVDIHDRPAVDEDLTIANDNDHARATSRMAAWCRKQFADGKLDLNGNTADDRAHADKIAKRFGASLTGKQVLKVVRTERSKRKSKQPASSRDAKKPTGVAASTTSNKHATTPTSGLKRQTKSTEVHKNSLRCNKKQTVAVEVAAAYSSSASPAKRLVPPASPSTSAATKALVEQHVQLQKKVSPCKPGGICDVMARQNETLRAIENDPGLPYESLYEIGYETNKVSTA